MRIFLSTILLSLLTACGGNIEPETLNIKAAGADGEARRTIEGITTKLISPYLNWQVSRQTRAGFLVLAARDGQLQYATSAGYADIANDIPMTPSTRVRIASMTKPVTAVAAMQLIEAGRLKLSDPVAIYLPEFAHTRVARSPLRGSDGNFDTEPAFRPLTVRDMLEFRTGLGGTLGSEPTDLDAAHAWDALGKLSLEHKVAHLAGLPLQEQPGTRWRYGSSLDVIARIIEIVSGKSFEAYLTANILTPLGMNDTGFMPPPEQRQGIAKHYRYDDSDALVEAKDRAWGLKSRISGSGGLISTAEDYMRFALMLWNKGTYNGRQIITPETHALMTRAHVPDGVLAGAGFKGLGWGLGLSVVTDELETPFSTHNGDYWWSGYYGTHFWVSPETGLVMLVMVQHVPANGLGPGKGREIPYVVQELLFRAL